MGQKCSQPNWITYHFENLYSEDQFLFNSNYFSSKTDLHHHSCIPFHSPFNCNFTHLPFVYPISFHSSPQLCLFDLPYFCFNLPKIVVLSCWTGLLDCPTLSCPVLLFLAFHLPGSPLVLSHVPSPPPPCFVALFTSRFPLSSRLFQFHLSSRVFLPSFSVLDCVDCVDYGFAMWYSWFASFFFILWLFANLE